MFGIENRRGSCDNLRVRRGGGDSGSGAIVRGNIFCKIYSNVKHHTVTSMCHPKVWCCFDCSEVWR